MLRESEPRGAQEYEDRQYRLCKWEKRNREGGKKCSRRRLVCEKNRGERRGRGEGNRWVANSDKILSEDELEQDHYVALDDT